MKKRLSAAALTLCVVLTLLSPAALASEGAAGFSLPAVTELTVTYRAGGTDQTVSLLRDQPQIALPAGSKPLFTVRFDSSQRIDQVFITSTRDGEVNYLEAFPSGGDTYVTSGWFDAGDPDYLPGTIGVVYSRKEITTTESPVAAPDIDMAAFKARLEEQGAWVDGGFTVEENSVRARVIFSEELTQADELYMDVSVSKLRNIDEQDDYTLYDWLGVYLNITDDPGAFSCQLTEADGGSCMLYLDAQDWNDSYTAIILIDGAEENTYYTAVFSCREWSPEAMGFALSTADYAGRDLLDYCGIFRDTAELATWVERSSGWDSAQKKEAIRRLDILNGRGGLVLLGVSCLPMFLDAPGLTEEISHLPAFLFSALLNCHTSQAEYFWERHIGMIQGCAPIEAVFTADTSDAGGEEADCVHAYSSVVTPPTCTERGYTMNTCGKCGESYIADYTGALGHSWGEWVTASRPSAAADGLRERVCSVCGYRETSVIPATGGSSGESGPAGSSAGSVSTGAVTAAGGVSAPVTTIAPSAAVNAGTASVTLSPLDAGAALRQAQANGSGEVVIAPVIAEEVSRAEVSIPSDFLDRISSRTEADLIIRTPAAQVSIRNDSLRELSGGGAVTVTTERKEHVVEFSLTEGARIVERLSGEVTLAIPVTDLTPGTAAVLLRSDGTRQVIRKSVADSGSLIVPLNGSARLEITDNAKHFSDVTEDSWASDAVAYVSGHELFSGTGADTFSPNAPMTRGMLAVVLHNLEHNPAAPGGSVFRDVGTSNWNAEAIAWASSRGIVSGYGDGLFGPDDHITREQLAVMLWRYAGSPAPAGRAMRFDDLDTAGGYTLAALQWAVERNILHGYEDNRLGPKGQATRAETAQMLKNYAENLVRQDR